MTENNELKEPKEPKEAVSEGSSPEARIAELEGLLSRRDTELGGANTRIAELERAVSDSAGRQKQLQESLNQAVSSYKALVAQSNPDILGELIAGDSVDAINSSLKSARELVSKVRSGVEAEIASVKVPAGAPQRTPLDLSALSPREKIQYGIGGKK